jgi:hypothetical protein
MLSQVPERSRQDRSQQPHAMIALVLLQVILSTCAFLDMRVLRRSATSASRATPPVVHVIAAWVDTYTNTRRQRSLRGR